MEGYRFHAGDLPEGFELGFEVSLFNEPAHRLMQAPSGWQSFYILHDKDFKALAAWYIHVSGADANSPFRAPFGSVDASGQLPPRVLFEFLAFVESNLATVGVRRMLVKNAPHAYFAEHITLLETFFFNRGYQVVNAEVSTCLDTKTSGEALLDAWEKRKLRQAREANLLFRPLPLEQLHHVYHFIEACRARKQYKLSMTFDQLQAATMTFPAHYSLFGVFSQEQLVAASVSIRVRQHVLYNFYSDHDSAFDALSPVVLLIEGLQYYCASQHIACLDLGTSAVNGLPNFGLLDFKRRLGGRATQKLTFAKDLA